MTKDAVATMGTILENDVGGRDAVHVAVIAVMAKSSLSPGEHVGVRLHNGSYLAMPKINPIGIVDPFLDRDVRRGDRFWLYLYPRTITSLCHNWTHPAFSDGEDKTVYYAPVQRISSEQWLKKYLIDTDGPDYESLLDAVQRHDGGEWLRVGTDASGDISKNDEFWDHVEVVIGKRIPKEHRATYYSCAC